MAVQDTTLDVISPQTQEQETLVALESFFASEALAQGTHQQGSTSEAKLVGVHGETVLPPSLAQALRRIAHYLAQGEQVVVTPVHEELTTQEAADLLNVSRAYLLKLLDKGELPYVKTGTHRRIRLDDLLLYKRQRDATRREALAKLTEVSEELGLY